MPFYLIYLEFQLFLGQPEQISNILKKCIPDLNAVEFQMCIPALCLAYSDYLKLHFTQICQTKPLLKESGVLRHT